MGGEAVAKPTKPQLRGLFHAQLKRNLITTFVLVAGCGVSFYLLHNRRQKNAVAEFYKNYDIDKEFDIMRGKKLFESCNVVDG